MKKKLLSLFLSVIMILSMTTGVFAAESEGLSNFSKIYDYYNQFKDVNPNSWYAESVKTVYEYGLVKGSSETSFAPDGNLTIGATLALACRLHSIYHTGTADFIQGTPWYKVYMDYAESNGIIAPGEFSNMNANATRRQFAAILSKSFPSEALPAINEISDGSIPDLTMGSMNCNDIYSLYRAGILTGSNKYGSFEPETTIKRSAVATIIARMADPGLRKTGIKFEKPMPKPVPEPKPTPKPVPKPSKVPQEYKNALQKAKQYNDLFHMSKAALYSQLTSPYGSGFSDAAAQYAIDNLKVNYSSNALIQAKSYLEVSPFSKVGLYKQLISEYGGKFTVSEGQYAIDHLNVDYKKCALEKGKIYLEIMPFSKYELYNQLTSSYGDAFTAAEAQYAVDILFG